MVNAEADSDAPVGSAGATEPPSSSSSVTGTTVNKALEWMHQLPSTHVIAVFYHLGQSRFNKLNLFLEMSLLDAVVRNKNVTQNRQNSSRLTVQYKHVHCTSHGSDSSCLTPCPYCVPVLNCMKNLNSVNC